MAMGLGEGQAIFDLKTQINLKLHRSQRQAGSKPKSSHQLQHPRAHTGSLLAKDPSCSGSELCGLPASKMPGHHWWSCLRAGQQLSVAWFCLYLPELPLGSFTLAKAPDVPIPPSARRFWYSYSPD